MGIQRGPMGRLWVGYGRTALLHASSMGQPWVVLGSSMGRPLDLLKVTRGYTVLLHGLRMRHPWVYSAVQWVTHWS